MKKSHGLHLARLGKKSGGRKRGKRGGKRRGRRGHR